MSLLFTDEQSRLKIFAFAFSPNAATAGGSTAGGSLSLSETPEALDRAICLTLWEGEWIEKALCLVWAVKLLDYD